MAVVVPWRGVEIEFGARYAYRYPFLVVRSWLAVSGDLVAKETFASPDGEMLEGGFLDQAGQEHRVRLEHGKPDTWRGLLPFVLIVDREVVARGQNRLGESLRQRLLLIAAVVLAVGVLLFGLMLVA